MGGSIYIYIYMYIKRESEFYPKVCIHILKSICTLLIYKIFSTHSRNK